MVSSSAVIRVCSADACTGLAPMAATATPASQARPGRNRMISKRKTPSAPCQVLGKYWLEKERTNSRRTGGDEHGGDADIAAQNGEEDEFARSRPEGEIGIDMAERERRQRAADATEDGGNHEIDAVDPSHRGAEIFHAYLVVARGERQKPAHRIEMDTAQRRGDDGHETGKHETARSWHLAIAPDGSRKRWAHADSSRRSRRANRSC